MARLAGSSSSETVSTAHGENTSLGSTILNVLYKIIQASEQDNRFHNNLRYTSTSDQQCVLCSRPIRPINQINRIRIPPAHIPKHARRTHHVPRRPAPPLTQVPSRVIVTDSQDPVLLPRIPIQHALHRDLLELLDTRLVLQRIAPSCPVQENPLAVVDRVG